MSELLVVARVRRPHGLAGEVSVDVVSDFPERFSAGVSLLWRRGPSERRLTLSGVRPNASRLLLHFEGIENVDAARALQGGDLCVTAAEAHTPPPGFYYGHEIRGFACEDADGRLLGRVTGLEQTPAGPMLSVEVKPGREALVPFAHPIVVDVDRETRRIVLAPPEGLLEL